MTIRVEIAERLYRLTIPPEDEERVRRAAKHIKTEIEGLKRTYEASLTEYLAMAAMRISIENEENKERLSMAPEALKLKALAAQLDEWVTQQEEGNTPQKAASSALTVAEGGAIVKPKAKRGRPRKTPRTE